MTEHPPHNVDAEENVLGAMLVADETVAPVLESGLQAEDFYRDQNREIYGAIRDLATKKIPVMSMSVVELLNKRNTLQADGKDYVYSLAATCPAASNATYYAGLVRSAAIERRIQDVGRRLTADPAMNGDLGDAVKELQGLVEDSTPDTKALEVMSAKEVCELPEPDVSDELLGSLVIRQNRLVVGAPTGEGKTTISLAIVKAIVTGAEFLGFAGQGDCKALVIDAEQGIRTIKRRLNEAGLTESEQVDYVRIPDGLSLDTDMADVALVERVLDEKDYDIVLADPLYKLHTGDSNAEREAVDLMCQFDTWRDKYGFALILPVHCRKPPIGAKFSINELFGSTAYARGAEVVIGVRRLSDGYAHLYWLKDRDGDLEIGTRWGLIYDKDEGFRRDPNEGKKSTREKLIDLFEENPEAKGWSQERLAEAMKVKQSTVQRALKEIEKDADIDEKQTQSELDWE